MENKYYLAVETKPNNYFPIHLFDLKIFGNEDTTRLEKIDALTLKFTKKEIMKSIWEANLLEVQDSMPLVIIYNEKSKPRKVKALTKDISFHMWDFMKENYSDKNFQNKIINFFHHKISDEELEKIKNTTDMTSFLKEISQLSYMNQRKLYFYLYEN